MRHTRPSTLNRQIVLFPPAGPDRRVELAAPQRRELIRALVGSWVVRGLIRCGLLEASQVLPCAPWQIDPEALDTDAIRTAAKNVVRGRHRGPGSRIGDGHNLEIPGI